MEKAFTRIDAMTPAEARENAEALQCAVDANNYAEADEHESMKKKSNCAKTLRDFMEKSRTSSASLQDALQAQVNKLSAGGADNGKQGASSEASASASASARGEASSSSSPLEHSPHASVRQVMQNRQRVQEAQKSEAQKTLQEVSDIVSKITGAPVFATTVAGDGSTASMMKGVSAKQQQDGALPEQMLAEGFGPAATSLGLGPGLAGMVRAPGFGNYAAMDAANAKLAGGAGAGASSSRGSTTFTSEKAAASPTKFQLHSPRPSVYKQTDYRQLKSILLYFDQSSYAKDIASGGGTGKGRRSVLGPTEREGIKFIQIRDVDGDVRRYPKMRGCQSPSEFMKA